jgi:hypothetical protein
MRLKKIRVPKNRAVTRVLTFVVLAYIRLIICNCNCPNGVGAPLRTNAHGFGSFGGFLDMSPVGVLATVLAIVWEVLVLSSLELLLPSSLGQQLLRLVSGQDIEGLVDV